jgi:hypothetical protein
MIARRIAMEVSENEITNINCFQEPTTHLTQNVIIELLIVIIY